MDKKGVNTGPPLERITCTIAEACAAAGCQRSTIYREHNEGRLKIRKMGRKSFLLVSDVKDWIDRLPVAHFKRPANAGWLDE